ncbi:MAG: hypothetical protein ACYCS1_11835 [Gammaproteobacteria bacterium]
MTDQTIAPTARAAPTRHSKVHGAIYSDNLFAGLFAGTRPRYDDRRLGGTGPL